MNKCIFLVILLISPASVLLARFTSVDPKRENHNVYSYVGNNPVNFLDPDGRAIKPLNKESLAIVKLMTPKKLHKFIQINESGFIDKELINKAKTNDPNFLALQYIVNNEMIVEVSTGTSVKQRSEGKVVVADFFFEKPGVVEVNGVKFKVEMSAWFGSTLTPDPGSLTQSMNENVQVVVSNDKGLVAFDKNLMVVTMAHELFVHVFPYLKNEPFEHNVKAVDDQVPVVEERTRNIIKSNSEK